MTEQPREVAPPADESWWDALTDPLTVIMMVWVAMTYAIVGGAVLLAWSAGAL